LLQKFFQFIFWIGYLAVLLTAFVPVAGELDKKFLGPDSFHIRLDHLFHFSVYFLICIYYLAGQLKGFSLFGTEPLLKFIILVVILATLTEVVQLWIPERAFNPVDWIANMAGVVIGVGVIKVIGDL
jgi:VanZ family protein